MQLIEAYGPANGRASSADHSRVIRAGYGADAIYSRSAHASLVDWAWLSDEIGQPLLSISGALFLGAPGNPYVQATESTLGRLGIEAERLDPVRLRGRYPQIDVAGLGDALFEPQAGVLRARLAVQSLVDLMLTRRLIDYRIARVARLDESRARPEVAVTIGTPIDADVYICACGPWLPAILPRAVGDRIRATRQEVLYLGVPPGDDRYSLSRLPVWIDFEAGLYGIPDVDACGFKVGIDRHGPQIDPDRDDRVLAPQVVDDTRAWLARRFPGMAGAPLLDGRVCQYENTCNGDFIIDRHPAWPELWIVGGGSGHGFKHGPAVGRHVAALIDGRAEPEPRFALATKTTVASRAVY